MSKPKREVLKFRQIHSRIGLRYAVPVYERRLYVHKK